MFQNIADVKRLDINSKNNIYTGFRNGKKVFIKEYILRKGLESEDAEKANSEILCYKNLKLKNSPELLEYSIKDRYIILDFVPMQILDKTQENLERVLALYNKEIMNVSAPFLHKFSLDYYTEGLNFRLDTLYKEKIIPNVEKIKEIFANNLYSIKQSKIGFSHGDFHWSNINEYNGKLFLVDFEHACNQPQMYDLATFAVSFCGTNLFNPCLNVMKRMENFDEEIFNIMAIRRTIELLYHFKNNPEYSIFKSCKEVLSKLEKEHY